MEAMGQRKARLTSLRNVFTAFAACLLIAAAVFEATGLGYEAPIALFFAIAGMAVVFWMKVSDASQETMSRGMGKATS